MVLQQSPGHHQGGFAVQAVVQAGEGAPGQRRRWKGQAEGSRVSWTVARVVVGVMVDVVGDSTLAGRWGCC